MCHVFSAHQRLFAEIIIQPTTVVKAELLLPLSQGISSALHFTVIHLYIQLKDVYVSSL